jgi:cysteine desulfurase
MLPFFNENFGNASSRTHAYGWKAEEAVNIAREQVAAFINAEESEIVFTSGATEAINLAIKGVAEAYVSKGKHIVTVASEHKAVLDTCNYLGKKGFEITILSVKQDGLVDLNELNSAIRSDTVLVCVMHANNETGVIQPIREIAGITHAKNTLLFTDATQACGKVRVDVREINVDLLCLSAHKIYGPKGAGALFVRRKNPRVTVSPQIHGGGHEKNLRSGTLNVSGIAGFGKACELASSLLWEESARISLLRTKLEQGLTSTGRVSVNGNIKHRLPNTTNLCFHGRKADELIKQLPGLAFATGSACSSALPEPSHVLLSMGLNKDEAYSSIRFSFGRNSTEEEIELAIKFFSHLVN